MREHAIWSYLLSCMMVSVLFARFSLTGNEVSSIIHLWDMNAIGNHFVHMCIYRKIDHSHNFDNSSVQDFVYTVKYVQMCREQ